MSGSLLESARSALEEIEALEVLAVDTLGQKPSGAKASMEQQGTLKNVVEGMTAAASTTTNNGNTNILIRALYICVCR